MSELSLLLSDFAKGRPMQISQELQEIADRIGNDEKKRSQVDVAKWAKALAIDSVKHRDHLYERREK